MNDTTKPVAPAGFTLYTDSLQFGDAIAPLYFNAHSESIDNWRTGFFVQEKHINPIGICHGGALMTFADISFGSAIARHMHSAPLPTIHLSIDFLSPGKMGDWLEFSLDHLFTSRLLGTMAAVITGPHGLVARTNAIFRLPKTPFNPGK